MARLSNMWFHPIIIQFRATTVLLDQSERLKEAKIIMVHLQYFNFYIEMLLKLNQ